MQNIDWEITEDEIMVIRIDLKQERGHTEKYNSIRIASSNGPVALTQINGKPDERGIRWAVNMYRPFANEEERAEASEARRRAALND